MVCQVLYDKNRRFKKTTSKRKLVTILRYAAFASVGRCRWWANAPGFAMLVFYHFKEKHEIFFSMWMHFLPTAGYCWWHCHSLFMLETTNIAQNSSLPFIYFSLLQLNTVRTIQAKDSVNLEKKKIINEKSFKPDVGTRSTELVAKQFYQTIISICVLIPFWAEWSSRPCKSLFLFAYHSSLLERFWEWPLI